MESSIDGSGMGTVVGVLQVVLEWAQVLECSASDSGMGTVVGALQVVLERAQVLGFLQVVLERAQALGCLADGFDSIRMAHRAKRFISLMENSERGALTVHKK